VFILLLLLVDVSDIDSLFSEFAGQRSRRGAYTKSTKKIKLLPLKRRQFCFFISNGCYDFKSENIKNKI
jgi:hypothetical protein